MGLQKMKASFFKLKKMTKKMLLPQKIKQNEKNGILIRQYRGKCRVKELEGVKDQH